MHSLSPGMVFTKLLLEDSTKELRKFPFGVLAAQVREFETEHRVKQTIINTDPSFALLAFLSA